MLQDLIILLDDTSTSYCHYNNNIDKIQLISIDDLQAGIIFAMKHNLKVRFIYPSYEIPKKFKDAIETINHVKLMPADLYDKTLADVVIFNSYEEFSSKKIEEIKDKIVVLRLCRKDIINRVSTAYRVPVFKQISHLNIIIKDIETFTDKDFETYKQWLAELSFAVHKICSGGKNLQINLVTERILLEKMNNCNAGVENITLAPNGKFYICPAFYYENEKEDIGNIKEGISIKNQQLYKLEFAPVCSKCDAFHCKRCVWLNKKTTSEVNTPSHEKCVMAHLERNASEALLKGLKKAGLFPDKTIPTIDYLDPLEIDYEIKR